ncbi:unnamed protein product [Brassicogethes aeneus]|uniref:Tyrosine specific protein phosphatases domain-containing protein n=1 Tax=Brassicogethes aeneus TaxID=1431903 RepID=A0A9P0BER5_BRAAE|nr:unnamed protein product [Brassicogethes aeneus]
MAPKNKVPKGWLGCPNNGIRLIESKFMPLKTPLSTNFDSKLGPDDWFHPRDIFDLAKKNKVKFGLWIDLTNTDRYYLRDEIENQNCDYKKLSCQGHGTLPTFRFVNQFFHLVEKFVWNNPYSCIAIHCTHGYNRTGFLIVSFLVEKLNYYVDDAVRLFAELRPPGIYRHEYVVELFRRYGDIRDAPPPIAKPSWSKD